MIRLGAAALFILFFTGCTPSAQKTAAFPVIKVNEHSLSSRDFGSRLARYLKNFDALAAKDPQNLSRAKENILRNFIFDSIILDYASSQNITVSDTDLDKEINQFRASYPDDVSFRRVLAEENLSFSEWKENLRTTLVSQRVFKKISEKVVEPTTAELLSAYEKNKDRFRKKERVYLRQIITDELGKAQAIRDELKKKDFIELAKKYSVSPEGKNGGLVGWVERGSIDIFDKAFTLNIGAISPVLESSYGFHIFKVERKAPPGVSTFEEVKEILRAELKGTREQAEYTAWLDKEIRRSRVFRDDQLISSITVETRGKK